MKTFNAGDELHCLLNKRSRYMSTSVSDKLGEDSCAFLFRHNFTFVQGFMATWLGVCQGTLTLVSLMTEESGYAFLRCTLQPRPDRAQIPIWRIRHYSAQLSLLGGIYVKRNNI